MNLQYFLDQISQHWTATKHM